ncbi:MAG: hypothetical protein R3F43_09420 [bacterium]
MRIRAAAAHRPDVVRLFADGHGRPGHPRARPPRHRVELGPHGRLRRRRPPWIAAQPADLAAFAVTGPQPVPGADCPP